VRQGEVADKLYVLTDGEVDVVAQDATGAEHRIAALHAPSYFGEIGLLSEESARRTATVRTRGPTELYGLHKDDFLGLLASNQQLAADVRALAQARATHTQAVLAGMADSPAASPG
jgi:CRP-like cAMP-binding protein